MSSPLPIRVKLDLTRINSVEYNHVWFPVIRCSLSLISDLKSSICNKYDLPCDDTELFLSGALLRDDDTVLLLREDDDIQVICKEQCSPSCDVDYLKSRKRKRKEEYGVGLNGSFIADSVSHVSENSRNDDIEQDDVQPPAKSKKIDEHQSHQTSLDASIQVLLNESELLTYDEQPSCSYTVENDALTVKKKNKKKSKEKRKRDFKSSSVCNAEEKTNYSPSNDIPANSFLSRDTMETSPNVNSSQERKENLLQTIQSKLSSDSVGNSAVDNRETDDKQMLLSSQEELNSTYDIGSKPDQLVSTPARLDSTNCRKKKRKRRRRRRHDTESNMNVTLDSSSEPKTEIAVQAPNVETKNKHIRFESSSKVMDSNEDGSDSCNEALFISLSQESCGSLGNSEFATPTTAKSMRTKNTSYDSACPESIAQKLQQQQTPVSKGPFKQKPDQSSTAGKSVPNIEEPVEYLRIQMNEIPFDAVNDERLKSYNINSTSSLKKNFAVQMTSNDPRIKILPSQNGKSVVSESDIRVEGPSLSDQRNYESFPLLFTTPPVGAFIAFKLLELSELYCPEISDYKEGRVIAKDMSQDTLTIELIKEEIKKPKTGKFENLYESDTETEKEVEVIKNINCKWNDLIGTRLISSPV